MSTFPAERTDEIAGGPTAAHQRRQPSLTVQEQKGLANEFLQNALLTAVATSMINARAEKRSLRLLAPVATYLPRHTDYVVLQQGGAALPIFTPALTRDVGEY